MTKRSPDRLGRGNVAPPLTYRPGRKNRWLLPKPPRHPKVSSMPFALSTYLFNITDPNFMDPPDYGNIATSVPAGSYVEAMVLATVPVDQPIDVYLTLLDPAQTAPGWLQVYRFNPDAIPDTSLVLRSIPPKNEGNVPDATWMLYIAQAISLADLRIQGITRFITPTIGSGKLVIKIYS